MNYIDEKIEEVKCKNISCTFHDKKFDQNCSGKYLNGESALPRCEKYIPETVKTNSK